MLKSRTHAKSAPKKAVHKTTKNKMHTKAKKAPVVAKRPAAPVAVMNHSLAAVPKHTTRRAHNTPVFTTSTQSLWTNKDVPLNDSLLTYPLKGEQQNGKYGTQKIPELFTTDTPNFKKMLKPVSFDGTSLEERPIHNILTSEEFCEQFGIVPVTGDVAHCVGTPDGPHPQEFIQVFNATPTKPQACKYCGLKFIKKEYLEDVKAAFAQEM